MVYYKEEQKVRSVWVWGIFSLSTLVMMWLLISKIHSNRNEQNIELETHWLLIITALTFGIMLLTGYLLYNANLQLQIKDRAVHYKYFPFIRSWRKIKKEDINTFSIRRYNPIQDYGGCGYRFSFTKGRALTVKGKYGLQLNYAKDKNLLIGTQNPEEVGRVMNELMKKQEPHG